MIYPVLGWFSPFQPTSHKVKIIRSRGNKGRLKIKLWVLRKAKGKGFTNDPNLRTGQPKVIYALRAESFVNAGKLPAHRTLSIICAKRLCCLLGEAG